MDAAHKATDKEIAKIQRHLSGIYAKAERDISTEMRKWIKSIEKQAAILLQAITDAKTESALTAARTAYKQFYVGAVKSDKAFTKTAQNATERLYRANLDAAKYINGKTAGIYARNYNHTGKELQDGLDGYSFKPITEEEADKDGQIARQTVDEKKDKSWNGKNLSNAVVAGAVMLWGVDRIAKYAASSTAKKNRDGANRQASDMLSDAESKGRLDSMYRAYDEGFDGVQKEWICVFDNRTRDTHIEYNDIGPVDLDYEYNDGLKRPKDSNCSDLADVCNCRCALTTHFGFARGTTRAARRGDVTGSYKKPSSFEGTETEYVSQMSYKDWMKWRSR